MITEYDNDALDQVTKAKSDFLRLMEATLIKLHGLDLTGTEKHDLKDAIVDERDTFATSVMTWRTGLNLLMGYIKSATKGAGGPPVAEDDGLTELINAKETLFAADMNTKDEAPPNPADPDLDKISVINWLQDHFDQR